MNDVHQAILPDQPKDFLEHPQVKDSFAALDKEFNSIKGTLNQIGVARTATLVDGVAEDDTSPLQLSPLPVRNKELKSLNSAMLPKDPPLSAVATSNLGTILSEKHTPSSILQSKASKILALET